METVIKKISIQVDIECKKCGFKGEVIATTQYYINCPECDKPVYVGRLTGAVK